jgi:hypothetical protein
LPLRALGLIPQSKTEILDYFLMKIEIDIDEAIRAVALWIDVWKKRFGQEPTAADVLHSALLPRLLSGKPLLHNAPPLRFSRPDYTLAEGGEVEVSEIRDEGDEVVIDQARQWRWAGDGELVHVPTGDVYQIKGKRLKKRS